MNLREVEKIKGRMRTLEQEAKKAHFVWSSRALGKTRNSSVRGNRIMQVAGVCR